MNRHLRTYRLVFATAIFATAIALTGIGRADSSEQFELREATIADIQAAYRDGILSPQHLVSMYLARIAVLDRSNLPQPLKGGVGNQPLNSFMHVNENALADAGRMDPDDRMDGDDDGARPLFQVPGADLTKVGYGFNPYDPRIDPRTNAPFNDGRPVLATGGSSSGPGIAVSANLATVGVGTETSGSILSPSGQNMDVGIKPT